MRIRDYEVKETNEALLAKGYELPRFDRSKVKENTLIMNKR